MKKYIRDMSYEEIAERLAKGEKVLEEIERGYYLFDDKMKIINYYDFKGSLSYINVNLPIKRPIYFEVEEPFEITESGLYKTRDGRKAFVSYVKTDELYPPTGMIEGSREKYSWTKEGYDIDYGTHNTDIVSKWED